MYRDIVVPLDGSLLSEYAIPFAQETARRGQGRVLLVRAMPETLIVPDMSLTLQRTVALTARRECEKAVQRWAADDVPMQVVLKVGWPVEEILKASAGRDLVVMTTHGRSGLSRWVLGSIAEKVIRLAPVPVLAIHPPEKHTPASARAAALRMFRDVAVPLDGSVLAERTLAELRQFAGEDTRINLVRVVPRSATAEATDGADSYLEQMAQRFQARGVKVTRSVQESDAPAEAILKYAVRTGCGLVAMTTHGASGIREWLLGSTTDKVIHRGPVPVLAIRASRKPWKGGRRPPVKAVI